MKRRSAVIVLSAIVCASMTMSGCGFINIFSTLKSVLSSNSIDKMLENAQEKLEDADSDEASYEISTDVVLKSSGVSLKVPLKEKTKVENYQEDSSSHWKGSYSAGDEKSGQSISGKFEEYCVSKDGDPYTYVSQDSGSWYCKESDNDKTSLSEEADILKIAASHVDDFRLEKKTVEFKGEDCKVITGTLDAGKFTDWLQILMDIGDDTFSAQELDGEGEVSINIYFSGNGKQLYAINLDQDNADYSLSGMGKTYYSGMTGLEATLENLSASVVYDDFDSVDEITLPKKAENAIPYDDTSDSDSPDDDYYSSSSSDDSDYYDDSSNESSSSDTYDYEESGSYLQDTKDLDKITLNDKTYTFPIKMSDLTAAGFTIDEEDADKQVDADSEEFITMHTSKESSIYLAVYNSGTAAASVNDCEVYGISVYSDSIEDLKVAYPKGFSLDSTLDDLTKMLGDPSNTYKDKTSDYASYGWSDKENKYNLEVTFNDGKIDSISMYYYYMY